MPPIAIVALAAALGGYLFFGKKKAPKAAQYQPTAYDPNLKLAHQGFASPAPLDPNAERRKAVLDVMNKFKNGPLQAAWNSVDYLRNFAGNLTEPFLADIKTEVFNRIAELDKAKGLTKASPIVPAAPAPSSPSPFAQVKSVVSTVQSTVNTGKSIAAQVDAGFNLNADAGFKF
jgi:hypothetical protein